MDGLVIRSLFSRHFLTIPILGLNSMTRVVEEYTHGIPALRMWFCVLKLPVEGIKSARGAVLRMWAEKGHDVWSVLISLI